MNLKMLWIFGLLATPALAATTADVGNAHYIFEDRAFAELFDQTLIFGHTLSADFMIDTISKSKGPGTILAEVYAGRPVMANLAEPRTRAALAKRTDLETLDTLTKADCRQVEADRSAEKQRLCEIIMNETRWARWIRRVRAALPLSINLEPGLDKIARLVYGIDDDSAPTHRLDFMNRVYQKSTVIVALDAFYLSATANMLACTYIDVDDVFEKFVNKAFRDGKVTILGNVPLEDYRTFSFPNQLAIQPQVEECRVHINRALARSCRTDRNCYLVRMDEIVSDLERDGYLTLKSGRKISRVQTRPDGVNLSNQGTQFVVERILSQLRENPPRPATTLPVLRP